VDWWGILRSETNTSHPRNNQREALSFSRRQGGGELGIRKTQADQKAPLSIQVRLGKEDTLKSEEIARGRDSVRNQKIGRT